MKPTIRIAFADAPGETNPTYIRAILDQRYEVVIDERAPDYVIYFPFGNKHLDFKDSIRIFFATENVRPDFNLCDYAFSYDWLTLGDRHFRTPNFVLYPQWGDLLARSRSDVRDLGAKPDFCNFVYSNAKGHPFRDVFFEKLNQVRPVESFGRHLKNSSRAIGDAYMGDWSAPKVDAQRSFRFSIAFENSTTPGYTTEKIVHALAADTIPLYWGDPLVEKVFNPGRIINLNQMSADEAIARIIALDDDPQAYLTMVNQPFFRDEAAVALLTEQALLDAFDAIFARPKAEAARRNPHYFGKIYEDRRREEIRAYEIVRKFKRLKRLIFRK